jgi:uncharacterized protein with NRDE domain
VCLLIVLTRAHSRYPLVVAANRDEQLDRPAQPMAVLRAESPRVLGGRDLLAGGTWLAVNEHGLVVGLTNQPARAGKDPTRRSRGALPLALATCASAELAVLALVAGFQPADYNPAFLLVGDREALFSVDMTGGDAPVIEPLPPGMYVLENRPLGERSAKVDHVRSLLAGAQDLSGDALQARLEVVLADHQIPTPTPEKPPGRAGRGPVPATAACVHAERYGTRWSGIVMVGPNARVPVPPKFHFADGPPCAAPFLDATPLWSTEALGDV